MKSSSFRGGVGFKRQMTTKIDNRILKIHSSTLPIFTVEKKKRRWGGVALVKRNQAAGAISRYVQYIRIDIRSKKKKKKPNKLIQ